MTPRSDTIFALSSGAPPAAIAVVRISGPEALPVVKLLTNKDVMPRHATLSTLINQDVELDNALVLNFPAPHSATGEDVAELHLHGGRATVAAVLHALADIPNLRPAEPGEFTRRAFANGRMDLNQAEGLADLLAAETEAQRRAAMAMAGGALTRLIDDWRNDVLDAAARLEAQIDYYESDDDVMPWPTRQADLTALVERIQKALDAPPSERLHDGLRVVIAGPPNAGKSTLFNALAGRNAAIVTPIAGTTRDVIEAPVRMGDVAVLLIDTAGLHDASDDAIEIEGMRRGENAMDSAHVVLWLGDGNAPRGIGRSIKIAAMADLEPHGAGLPVSAKTGEGLAGLRAQLIEIAREDLREDGVALNVRQFREIANVVAHLKAATVDDPLFAAEELRLARMALDRLQGRSGVEEMLDALFERFCLGK